MVHFSLGWLDSGVINVQQDISILMRTTQMAVQSAGVMVSQTLALVVTSSGKRGKSTSALNVIHGITEIKTKAFTHLKLAQGPKEKLSIQHYPYSLQRKWCPIAHG